MAPIMNATRKRSASASDLDEEIVRPSKIQRLDSTHQDAAVAVVEASDDSHNISDGSGFIIDTSYGSTNRGEHAQQIGRWMNEVPADAGEAVDQEVVEAEPFDVAPVAFGEDLQGQAPVNGIDQALVPYPGEIEQPAYAGYGGVQQGVDYGYYGQPYGEYAQEAVGDGYPFFQGYEHMLDFTGYFDDEGEQAEVMENLHRDLAAGEELLQAEEEAAQEQLSVSDYGEPGFFVDGNRVADHPVIRAIVQGPAYPAAHYQPIAYEGAAQSRQGAGYDAQEGFEAGAANVAGGNHGADEAENDRPDDYGSSEHPIEADDDDSASGEDDDDEPDDDESDADEPDNDELDDDDEPEDYGSEEHPIDVDDNSSSEGDDDEDDEQSPSPSSSDVDDAQPLAPGQAYVYISATEQQQARMFFNLEEEPANLAPGQAFVQVGRVEQSHARMLSALSSDEEEAEDNEPAPLAPGQAYVQVGRVEQNHARMLSALGSDEEGEDEDADEGENEDEGEDEGEDEDKGEVDDNDGDKSDDAGA